MSNPLSLVCLCCLYLFISTDIMICSKKMYPLTIFIWITWGNLLRSVPRVSVGHQHMNFFQKYFDKKSFCMLVYIG